MAKYASIGAGGSMDRYAREQASARLNRFAVQLRRASRSPDADAIHDLRVSIRRLSQCLKIFGEFFPAREVKKVRRRLRKILGAAAEVRNRDIAAELARKAGVSADSPVLARLSDERMITGKELEVALKRWRQRELSSRWRTKLGV